LIEELLEIGDAEAEFDRAGRVFLRRRMQAEFGFAGCELAPAGRAEDERQAQSVAIPDCR
jgi:hypothetical protein